jgi:DNA-binding transcriptional regulator YdaS (Cro superfamily)
MTLAEYISDLKISPEEFANRLDGVSPGGLRKWISGERVPRKEHMEKIFEVTEGKVTPNDFYGVGPVPITAEAAE